MRHRDRRKPRPRPAARAISGAAAAMLAVGYVLSVSGCGRTTPASKEGSTGAGTGAARSASQAAAPSPSHHEREPIDRAITLWMRGDHSGALLAVERAAGRPPTSIGEVSFVLISQDEYEATPPSRIEELVRHMEEHNTPRVEAARAVFRAVLEEVPRRIESSDLDGAERLRDGMASLSAWLAAPERVPVFGNAGQVYLTLIAERIDPALERARGDRP
jgi:hypothetical protein